MTAWYHTIELPDGTVTPGWYDLRGVPEKLPLPSSLAGKRCLDVGTSSGFWAFEMERRGAEEVVAVDVSDPARQDWQGRPRDPEELRQAYLKSTDAFAMARDALGSRVDRRDLSVYDLAPETVGRFDFVFMGNLALHVRDPAGALAAVRSVVDGEFMSFEAISPSLTLLRPRTPAAKLWPLDEPRWWTPNAAGHRRLIEAAGFTVVRSGTRVFQPFGKGFPPPRLRAFRDAPLDQLAFWLFVRPVGALSAWAIARP